MGQVDTYGHEPRRRRRTPRFIRGPCTCGAPAAPRSGTRTRYGYTLHDGSPLVIHRHRQTPGVSRGMRDSEGLDVLAGYLSGSCRVKRPRPPPWRPLHQPGVIALPP